MAEREPPAVSFSAKKDQVGIINQQEIASDAVSTCSLNTLNVSSNVGVRRLRSTSSEAEIANNRKKCWWRTQQRLREFTENFIVRIFILLLLVVDIVCICVDMAIVFKNREKEVDDKDKATIRALSILSLCISCIFIMEISLRILSWGTVFWTNVVNVLDFFIVVITLGIGIADVALDHTDVVPKALVILRFIRVPRFIQFVRVLYTQRTFLSKSTRLMVSQNKRRFRKEGFDLDLCYITDRVVAMSFPSSGFLAFYRNPIREVAKFLDTYHFEHFWVYNLCSERSYDPSFFHGRVERIMIDDHNVPTIKEMIKFAQTSQSWLSADSANVIVVHCKGGKGRTGTIICTHMINSGDFQTAEECLHYFGQQRTDLQRGNKFQGVETPSQSRYVGYFEKIKRLHLIVPECKPLILQTLTIYGINNVGAGNGSDFQIEIYLKRKRVFQACLHDRTSQEQLVNLEHDLTNDKCTLSNFIGLCQLHDDVKVCFNSRNKAIPRGYEGRPFFFWFHVAFISTTTLTLRIPRNELDNLNKPKSWLVFPEHFAVELVFQIASIAAS